LIASIIPGKSSLMTIKTSLRPLVIVNDKIKLSEMISKIPPLPLKKKPSVV